ncbi:MAG: HD domain-containing protein [Pyrinomonadaceae bacterium]
MCKLEAAILLAVQAHQGQTDKAGQPYILHPLRMMTKMKTEAEMMAAVLHDVVEDTDWSLGRLREQGFPDEVLAAVECLTRGEGESYAAFIERVKTNRIATRVKLADLEDNMDVRRISNFTVTDAERMAKYNQAWQSLVESASS